MRPRHRLGRRHDLGRPRVRAPATVRPRRQRGSNASVGSAVTTVSSHSSRESRRPSSVVSQSYAGVTTSSSVAAHSSGASRRSCRWCRTCRTRRRCRRARPTPRLPASFHSASSTLGERQVAGVRGRRERLAPTPAWDRRRATRPTATRTTRRASATSIGGASAALVRKSSSSACRGHLDDDRFGIRRRRRPATRRARPARRRRGRARRCSNVLDRVATAAVMGSARRASSSNTSIGSAGRRVPVRRPGEAIDASLGHCTASSGSMRSIEPVARSRLGRRRRRRDVVCRRRVRAVAGVPRLRERSAPRRPGCAGAARRCPRSSRAPVAGRGARRRARCRPRCVAGAELGRRTVVPAAPPRRRRRIRRARRGRCRGSGCAPSRTRSAHAGSARRRARPRTATGPCVVCTLAKVLAQFLRDSVVERVRLGHDPRYRRAIAPPCRVSPVAVYALGDIEPRDPSRRLRPPGRDRHRQRDHRRRVDGLAPDRAAGRLRRTSGRRAHVDPGRHRGAHHRGAPDDRRRRLRDRSPRAPRVLHRSTTAPSSAPDRSCCTAAVVESGALVGAGAVVPNDMVVPSRRDGARRAGEACARTRSTTTRSAHRRASTWRTRRATAPSSAASTAPQPFT